MVFKKKAVLLWFSCIIYCIYGQSAGAEEKNTSKKILFELLGDSLKVEFKNNYTRVEYCPDNTCEVFITKKDIPADTLYDFVFLYFFHVSDYYYLEEFRHNVDKLFPKEILSKNVASLKCNNKSEMKKVKCVLEKIAERYSLSFKLVRYDEGKRIEYSENIVNVLNRMK